ncbi:response regulator [Cytobacillus sp. IB215316]|uniref:response regulator n=1 Tax=Cytobacillus sp. IB215316 TaxID=3097354 RepID=UPI002A147B53|nr:response regulator [Cytobacillus sp. IB215316]MDX8362406.1 response regulator [Cytobacillus sp. IB215316]
MFKLLIVEDEITIREGMEEMINWQQYGIEVCGICEDGLTGYQTFLATKPDILLTDIRMPQMNGLELIEKAQETGYDFLAILLSGYNEFSYAQEGIRLGAHDYLLKPCLPNDILNAVLTAKEKLETARESKVVKKTWDKHLPTLKWQKLSSWLKSADLNYKKHLDDIEELRISLQDANIQVGVIKIHYPTTHNTSKQKDNHYFQTVLDITNKFISDFYNNNYIEVFQHNYEIVWCANVTTSYNEQRLNEHLTSMVLHINKAIEYSISIGVGSIQPSINLLHLSYKEALNVIEYQFYEEASDSFLYSQLAQRAASTLNEPTFHTKAIAEQEEKILHFLEQEEFNLANDQLYSWLHQLSQNSTTSRKNLNMIATAFILELGKLLHRKNIQSNEWIQNQPYQIELITKAESFNELVNLVQENVNIIISLIKSQVPIHKTVKAALEIIHEKYHENITLDWLAKEVFVSTTYLSSLFKQELGINFLDYLHNFRINKSKPLLKDGLKVYAVAKLVGYQDERHFSSTFKKRVGQSPSEYQRKVG